MKSHIENEHKEDSNKNYTTKEIEVAVEENEILQECI